MKYLQKKVITPNEIDKIMIGVLAGNNPFLCNCEELGCQFNQDKDSTEDNPRQEFKTSTSKEEAVAFIVWLKLNTARK